eukprot:scaffold17460_cov128-Isochrysis_galbana.AAC.4
MSHQWPRRTAHTRTHTPLPHTRTHAPTRCRDWPGPKRRPRAVAAGAQWHQHIGAAHPGHLQRRRQGAL